ncbi:predicted protein [Chaetoceros tenuissimus]|uniref:Uncharacterized protein n=1 Tax=Chaetoceros tenuissimus TaxID=426638 RepID=A0AAD3H3A4_9STRA|nr:predicted protein [Chaetoceros tenuissimus]
MGKMNINRTVAIHLPFFEPEDVITCVGGFSTVVGVLYELGSADGGSVMDKETGLEEGAKESNPLDVGSTDSDGDVDGKVDTPLPMSDEGKLEELGLELGLGLVPRLLVGRVDSDGWIEGKEVPSSDELGNIDKLGDKLGEISAK